MNRFQSDQIISSVLRWSYHDTISGSREKLDCFAKGRARHHRAIGTNKANGGESYGKQILRSQDESLIQLGAALCDELKS